MLEIKNITKVFNAATVNEKVALDNLSLTLEDGDFVTVIGGNGAGKSTLLNAIAGTFAVDEGTISVDGVNITKLPEHKRAKFIGRVFQDPMTGTAADMWIEENMALAKMRGKIYTPKLNKKGKKAVVANFFGKTIYNLKNTFAWSIKKSDRETFKKMLTRLDLGLETRLSTKVGLLSGGQRQAITLLMASMNNPKLLLLDEHTAALDPKTAEKVLTITKEIVEEQNLTTVMITHNMKDAIAFGNRLIMMNAGKIILDIKGEEKKALTVEKLLSAFAKAGSDGAANDRMLLI